MKFIYFLRRKQLQILSEMKSSHKMLFAFVGGVGLILFWYGIWEGVKKIPIVGNPFVAMIIGACILSFTGLFVGSFVGREPDVIEQIEIDDNHIGEQ